MRRVRRHDAVYERRPASNCPQSQDCQSDASDEHHEKLYHIGHCNSGQTTSDGVNTDDNRREYQAHPDGNAEVFVQHESGRPEEHAENACEERAPEQGLDDADCEVVPHSEELGYGVDARLPVVRNEQQRRQDHRGNCADPLVVCLGDTETICAAGCAHVVVSADVRADDGHADDPPWQHLAGKEVVLFGFHELAEVDAKDRDGDQVCDYDEQVDSADAQ